MCAVALRQSRFGVSRVHGAIRAAIPGYIEPCDPTLREKPPRGEDWVYEIKADGYRAQLHLRDEGAKVYSRTGLDWARRDRRRRAAPLECDRRGLRTCRPH